MTWCPAAACLVVGLGIVGCSSTDRVDGSQAPAATAEPTSLPTELPSTTTIADPDVTIRDIASAWYGNAEIGGAVAVVGTPDGNVRIAAVGQAAPGVAAASDDMMRIGSITKTFTASLAVRLARQGLIDLDAPVADYLPDLGLGARESPFVGCSNHTSGITDPDPNELIARFRADPAHRFTHRRTHRPRCAPLAGFRR